MLSALIVLKQSMFKVNVAEFFTTIEVNVQLCNTTDN